MCVIGSPAFRPVRPVSGVRGELVVVAGDTEGGEPREVDRGGEEGEVGVHLHAAADTGASAAVPASHQMADLPLDLRAGRLVVGLPRGIGLAFATASELRLVRAEADRPPSRSGGAPRKQRA